MRTRNGDFKSKSVFDHDADRDMVDALRAAVVEDLHALHSRYPTRFGAVTAADLGAELYAEMREKYRRILQYGGFSPGKRPLANELIWKWTEATGKYVGCQFWSTGAKSVFDQEVVRSVGAWPITATQAKTLEKELSSKSRQDGIKLTHEHVYPIKDIKRLFPSTRSLTREEIRELLERQCVSCVLLESEHPRRVRGTSPNSWLRYKNAGIRLADNPTWLDSRLGSRQRAMIIEEGLV